VSANYCGKGYWAEKDWRGKEGKVPFLRAIGDTYIMALAYKSQPVITVGGKGFIF
jgi:hypothetical protein